MSTWPSSPQAPVHGHCPLVRLDSEMEIEPGKRTPLTLPNGSMAQSVDTRLDLDLEGVNASNTSVNTNGRL